MKIGGPGTLGDEDQLPIGHDLIEIGGIPDGSTQTLEEGPEQPLSGNQAGQAPGSVVEGSLPTSRRTVLLGSTGLRTHRLSLYSGRNKL